MVPGAVKRQAGMKKRRYLRLTQTGTTVLKPDTTKLKPGTAELKPGATELKTDTTKLEPDATELKTDATASKSAKAVRVSVRGRVILEYLARQSQDTDGWVPQVQVIQDIGGGVGSMTTLSRAGLIEIEQRQEFIEQEFAAMAETQPVGRLELTDEQKHALEQAEALIDEPGFNAVVLHGVTGSGKTELYIRCIDRVVARGEQALVMVPEIALTPQLVSRFVGYFGQVALVHSRLNSRQRHQQWRRIAEGRARVVVGARSAVFAPLDRLGLIVVDEEHEPSYKQDMSPRYHGRDAAIKLAQMRGITVILGSATPSLETLHNCQSRTHYHLLRLQRRVLNLPLPEVTVVDMLREARERKGRHILSRLLEDRLRHCLTAGRQAILLLNRRGHSNFVCCPSCEFVLTCPNCDVSLTYHRRPAEFDSQQRSWVMCHYCTHSSEVASLCPVCGRKLILIGPGTQKAEDELTRKLPEARIQRVDSDTMQAADYANVLAEFGTKRIDILVGTQMIGKGLDYPNVNLVGVLNADTALTLPDFRSSERSFQLIAQVAGRCGRARADGEVIVQSFMPNDPTIASACRHDYDGFSERELAVRQRCGVPPFARMARIIMRDTKLKKLESVAGELRRRIDQIVGAQGSAVNVRGPMPTSIARLENYHRCQILLQAERPEQIQTMLAQLRRDVLPGTTVHTIVDVDPINLM